MLAVTVTIHRKQIDELIQQGYEMGGNRRELLETLGDVVRVGFGDEFAAQGRPAWAPLQESTILARLRRTAGYQKRVATLRGRQKGLAGFRSRLATSAFYAGGGKRAQRRKLIRSAQGRMGRLGAGLAASRLRFLGGEHKILEDTGRLRRSVTARQGPGSIWRRTDKTAFTGTNLVYAATHQHGDKKRGIPARPFAVVSDETKDEMERATYWWVAGKLKQKRGQLRRLGA
jgi:phage gpG-like protein